MSFTGCICGRKVVGKMAETGKIELVKEWDKTFPKSEKVNHRKVTFQNRYGITLAADLYEPKEAAGKLAAIAVCGPFGAVKEQAAGLYAQTMAEKGFLTIAFDPSFTGESGGHPRSLNSNGGWNVIGCQSFLNMPILQYAHEIRSAVLLIHGEKAHSCYFSKDAYSRLKGDNKELFLIPDAVHTDLYDRTDIIPFDKIVSFFLENLK
jgi:fermentation-respiration switch protein FrsA (DUF1100 family)